MKELSVLILICQGKSEIGRVPVYYMDVLFADGYKKHT